MNENDSKVKRVTMWALRYILALTAVVVTMLIIEPTYFDMPIATAVAGLDGQNAPSGEFATAVTFDSKSEETILMVMGAKDRPLQITAEVESPGGQRILHERIFLETSSRNKPKWKNLHIPSIDTGTYTLRITQTEPGRISLFYYQGPFIARMIFLPSLMLALMIGFSIMGKGRTHAVQAEQQSVSAS